MLVAEEIRFTVISASNLPIRKRHKHCRPRVIFGVGRQTYTTREVPTATGDVVWKEQADFEIDDLCQEVLMTVKDKDSLIGHVRVPIATIPGICKRAMTLNIENPKKFKKTESGQLGSLTYEAYVTKGRLKNIPTGNETKSRTPIWEPEDESSGDDIVDAVEKETKQIEREAKHHRYKSKAIIRSISNITPGVVRRRLVANTAINQGDAKSFNKLKKEILVNQIIKQHSKIVELENVITAMECKIDDLTLACMVECPSVLAKLNPFMPELCSTPN